jgi:hypothetical protein
MMWLNHLRFTLCVLLVLFVYVPAGLLIKLILWSDRESIITYAKHLVSEMKEDIYFK